MPCSNLRCTLEKSPLPPILYIIMPRRKNNNNIRTIVQSNRPTGSTTSFPNQDLVFRRQNFNIVQNPPRQLSNQIWWGQFKYDTQFNASSTGISENNVWFQASTFSAVTNFLSCFDQYCIHSVVVTLSSTSVVTVPMRVWTAIDYDSVAALGSKLGIQGFGTCAFHSIAGDGSTSAERLLYPCVAPQLTNSSSLPVPAGVARAWVDSAYPTIQHFGFRSIIDTYYNSSAALEVTYTAIFGFRNSF